MAMKIQIHARAIFSPASSALVSNGHDHPPSSPGRPSRCQSLRSTVRPPRADRAVPTALQRAVARAREVAQGLIQQLVRRHVWWSDRAPALVS